MTRLKGGVGEKDGRRTRKRANAPPRQRLPPRQTHLPGRTHLYFTATTLLVSDCPGGDCGGDDCAIDEGGWVVLRLVRQWYVVVLFVVL